MKLIVRMDSEGLGKEYALGRSLTYVGLYLLLFFSFLFKKKMAPLSWQNLVFLIHNNTLFTELL